MKRKILALAAAFLLVGLFASLGSSVTAANLASRALITQPIDRSHLVTLYGNTRPEASARHDRGRVADEFQLNHMLLQLKRAPEAESAFAAYIDSLSDKTSPNFRHWMSAAAQGEKYGVAQQDIDAITNWLRSTRSSDCSCSGVPSRGSKKPMPWRSTEPGWQATSIG